MKAFRRHASLILLSLAAVFVLPAFLSFALPAWGPRGCSPVGGLAQAQPASYRAPVYSWRPNARSVDQIDLFRNDFHVGAHFRSDHNFYALVGDEWVKTAHPIPLPAEHAGEPVGEPVVQNFGLDLDHVEKRRGVYLHTRDGSRQCTYEEAADVIQNGLVDDRHKPQVTFISGDKAKREAFLKDAAGLGDVVTRAVPPDYVGLADSETGKPLFEVKGDTIYLQQPDGKVLARMPDVRPGDLAHLAKAIEGIRRPKPYEPDKDPDPRKSPDPVKPDASPLSPLAPILQSVPPAAWVLLGLALLGGVAAVARNTAPR